MLDHAHCTIVAYDTSNFVVSLDIVCVTIIENGHSLCYDIENGPTHTGSVFSRQ